MTIKRTMKAQGLNPRMMTRTAVTVLKSLPANLARGCIRAYQITLSPFIGNQCRFHPSCSNYALEAVDAHGALKGSWLALKRLGRCHPLNPGGFDPVPDAGEKKARYRLTPENTRSTNPALDGCPAPKEI